MRIIYACFVFSILGMALCSQNECLLQSSVMSSSSELSSDYHAQNGFGTSSGSLWCMGASNYWDSDPSPWLQINMESTLTVLGVKVTGKNSPENENSLMYFKISYSNDLQTWTFFRNHTKENNDVKRFPGFTEADILSGAVITHLFPHHVTARYLRIHAGRDYRHPGPCCITMDVLRLPQDCGHEALADANECNSDNGGCEHVCHNTADSYHCSCRTGYRLWLDGHRCNQKVYCPDGWYLMSGLGKCYLFAETTAPTYTSAQNACQAKAASLLVISSLEEKEWLDQMLSSGDNDTFWLGISRVTEESDWYWDDGYIVSVGEIPTTPDDAGELCAVTRGDEGLEARHCNDRHRYVCEKIKDSNENCTADWLESVPLRCYWLSAPGDRLTYYQAQHRCHQMKATLVSLLDTEQKDSLHSMLLDLSTLTEYWIGAEADNMNELQWLNGDGMDLSLLSVEDPSPAPWECVALTAELNITSVSCDNAMKYICEGLSTIDNLQSEFVAISTQTSAHLAQHDCLLKGGFLASIHSEDEWQNIIQLVSTESKRYWMIGLMDGVGLKHYDVWLDGTQVDLTAWLTGEPSGADDRCVYMDKDNGYLWVDLPCSTNASYICRLDNDLDVRLVSGYYGVADHHMASSSFLLHGNLNSFYGNSILQSRLDSQVYLKIDDNLPYGGGWKSDSADVQYVQITFDQEMMISGLITRSSEGDGCVVPSYKIKYYYEGKVSYYNSAQAITGNAGDDTGMLIALVPPVRAVALELVIEPHAGCSGLRWEVIGHPSRIVEDVNECSFIRLNDCPQLCVNTPGSYKCQCYHGYHLWSDGKTCIEDHVDCPPDFIDYGDECYKFHAKVTDRATASSQCEADGGRLTSVQSVSENEFLRHYVENVNATTDCTMWFLGMELTNSLSVDLWDDKTWLTFSGFSNSLPVTSSTNQAVFLDRSISWMWQYSPSNTAEACSICKLISTECQHSLIQGLSDTDIQASTSSGGHLTSASTAILPSNLLNAVTVDTALSEGWINVAFPANYTVSEIHYSAVRTACSLPFTMKYTASGDSYQDLLDGQGGVQQFYCGSPSSEITRQVFSQPITASAVKLTWPYQSGINMHSLVFELFGCLTDTVDIGKTAYCGSSFSMYKRTTDEQFDCTTFVECSPTAVVSSNYAIKMNNQYTCSNFYYKHHDSDCADSVYCALAPCTHGGTCVESPDGYYCLCPPAYNEVHCSKSLYYAIITPSDTSALTSDKITFAVVAGTSRSTYKIIMGDNYVCDAPLAIKLVSELDISVPQTLLSPDIHAVEYYRFSHRFYVPGTYRVQGIAEGGLAWETVETTLDVADAYVCSPSLHIQYELNMDMAVISSNFSNATLFVKSKNVLLAIQLVPGCESEFSSLDYHWTLLPHPVLCAEKSSVDLPISVKQDRASILIPGKLLNYGIYTVQLVLTGATAQGPFQRLAYGFISIAADGLIPSIDGGAARSVSANRNIVLDASLSVDPNSQNPYENLTFSWECYQGNQPCDFVESLWPSSDSKIPVTDSKLSIPKKTMTLNESYCFSVTVYKIGLSAVTTNQTLFILDPSLLEMNIRCKQNCGKKANPFDSIALLGTCMNCDQSVTLSFLWQVTSSNVPPEPFNWDADTSTGQQLASLVINAGALQLSTVYSFSLSVEASDGRESVLEYRFITGSMPTEGTCSISPPSGIVLNTEFAVLCQGFYDIDTPLLYRFYRVTDSESSLIYTSYKANHFGLRLFEGLPNVDYLQNFTMVISNVYEISVAVNLQAQINPVSSLPDPSDFSGFINSLVYNDANSSTPSLINDLINSNDVYGFASLVSTISLMLNNEASGDQGSVAIDIEQRAELKETLVTSMKDLTLHNVDDVLALASTLNNLLAVKEDVSESTEGHIRTCPYYRGRKDRKTPTGPLIAHDSPVEQIIYQDNAASLYDDMCETFLHEEPPSFVFAVKTADLLLDGMSSLMDFSSRRAHEVLTTGNISQIVLANSNATAQTIIDQSKSTSKKMLTGINKVAHGILGRMNVPRMEPVRLQNDDLAIALYNTPKAAIENKPLEIDRAASGQRVSLTFPKVSVLESAMSNAGVENSTGDLVIQMMLTDTNIYSWDVTSNDVTTPVLSVSLKDSDFNDVAINDLSEPIDVFLSINGSAVDTTYLQLVVPLHLYNATVRFVPQNVTVLNITNDQGKAISIRLSVDYPDLNLTVVANQSRRLTVDDFYDNPIQMPRPKETLKTYKSVEQDPNLILLPAPVDSESDTHYIGIAATEGMNGIAIFGDQVLGLEYINVNISVTVTSLSCLYWDETVEQWLSDGCTVSPFTTEKTLHCWCNHLTSFGGGFFVAPNYVDALDISLFLTFFDNPVVVCTVITIWILYFGLLYWAVRKDRQDVALTGVTVLEDNDPGDVYLYLVCTVTGWWREAGTSSNVFMYMRGTNGQSARHALRDSKRIRFLSGAEDWFLLSTPTSLGELEALTIWHDNVGASPSWYLNQVTVQDMQTNTTTFFLYDNWLSLDRGNIGIIGKIPAFDQDELTKNYGYQFWMKSSKDLRDGHLWISIFTKPCYSTFTRAQRLTCGLALLLTAMLTSIMFHGVPTDDPEDQLKMGDFSISLSDIVIGIESGLIMFPINLIIIQLFTKLAPRPQTTVSKKYSMTMRSTGAHSDVRSDDADEHGDTKENAGKKKRPPFRFPWWFLYIAWFLLFSVSLVSSYFVMLYGLKYGYNLSLEWLVSFMVAFFQSSLITQPIKVMLIAVLITMILKRPIPLDSNKPPVELEHDEEYLHAQLLENYKTSLPPDRLRPKHIKEPVSSSIIKGIRKRMRLEWRMQEVLRECIMYFTYVAVLLFMVHGHRNVTESYYATKSIEDMFIKTPDPRSKLAFDEVSSFSKMWTNIDTVLLPELFPAAADEKQLISNEASFLIGAARFRQLRIKPDSCHYPMGHMFDLFADKPCAANYWIGNEDMECYDGNWSSIASNDSEPTSRWCYQTTWQLKTIPCIAKQGSYSGGGYVFQIPNSRNNSKAAIKQLQDDVWLDGRTRALFIEFTLYNPNVNLFSVVMLLYEFTNTGGVHPFYQIFTCKLYHYTNGFEIFVAVCEVIFILYTLVLSYYEIKRYRKLKRTMYFSDPWSYTEITILALSYSIIGLFFQRMLSVDSVLEELRQAGGGESFISFYAASSWDFLLGYVMSFLVLIVLIKVLKLFRYNQRMSLLSKTLTYSSKSMACILTIITFVVIAFAHFSYLVFGSSVYGYGDVGETAMTLFNLALGVSDFYALQRADRILGPLFFFLFIFVVQWCLITMFLAIILEAFHAVRASLQAQHDFVIARYMASRLLQYFNVKSGVK